MQPYGYGPPPSPPKSSNVGLVIGLVAAVFVLLMVGVVVIGAVVFVKSSSRHAAVTVATAAPVPPAFTESYTSQNALVTVHYPADFVAKNMDKATLVLTRVNADGTTDLVEAAAVPNPRSDDVNEFARYSLSLMVKNVENVGDSYVETGRTTRACFQSFPGLEVTGSVTRKSGRNQTVRTCYFMGPSTGYVLRTSVPASHETIDQPLLQSIVDATELK